eukprot:scaffold57115_cov55-Attheya_sp.AAC.1
METQPLKLSSEHFRCKCFFFWRSTTIMVVTILSSLLCDCTKASTTGPPFVVGIGDHDGMTSRNSRTNPPPPSSHTRRIKSRWQPKETHHPAANGRQLLSWGQQDTLFRIRGGGNSIQKSDTTKDESILLQSNVPYMTLG